MIAAAMNLLAWTPFVHPIALPSSARLWLFLPIAVCVALVYRATRSKTAAEMPRLTLITFVNLVVGMCVLAVVALGLHEAVLRYFS